MFDSRKRAAAEFSGAAGKFSFANSVLLLKSHHFNAPRSSSLSAASWAFAIEMCTIQRQDRKSVCERGWRVLSVTMATRVHTIILHTPAVGKYIHLLVNAAGNWLHAVQTANWVESRQICVSRWAAESSCCAPPMRKKCHHQAYNLELLDLSLLALCFRV